MTFGEILSSQNDCDKNVLQFIRRSVSCIINDEIEYGCYISFDLCNDFESDCEKLY